MFSIVPRISVPTTKLLALEGKRDGRAYVVHRDSLVVKRKTAVRARC